MSGEPSSNHRVTGGEDAALDESQSHPGHDKEKGGMSCEEGSQQVDDSRADERDGNDRLPANCFGESPTRYLHYDVGIPKGSQDDSLCRRTPVEAVNLFLRTDDTWSEGRNCRRRIERRRN